MPNSISSLQSAIDTLDVTGPHNISVVGTCGPTAIRDHDRITITGGGAGTTIDAGGSLDALFIGGSHGISISAINLTGGEHGLLVGEGSTVSADAIKTFNNGRGIEIMENSFFRGTLIESHDNTVSGFRVNASTLSVDSIRAEPNGSSGITARASRIELHGNERVQR